MSGGNLLTTELEKFGVNRSARADDDGNLCVVPSAAGLPYQFFLTANGDGAGDYNLNGDYSLSQETFYLSPPARFEVYSIIITLIDSGTLPIDGYGGMPALTNGVVFSILQLDGYDFPILHTDLTPFKHNYDYFIMTPNITITDFSQSTNALIINFEAVAGYGKPLTLLPGEEFRMKLNDDFTSLIAQTVQLRGTLFV